MTAPPEPTPMDYQASYGFVSMLAGQIPEIKGLLDQATREKWTPQRFSYAVASTNWWKNTASNQREWIVSMATDPSTAQSQMLTGGAQLQDLAVQLGIPTLGIDQAKQIWLQSKLAGESDSQLRARLFRDGTKWANPQDAMANAGGRYGTLINTMMAQAEDYGYITGDWKKSPAANEVVNEANRLMLAGGDADPEAWKTKMINYASTKYAPFADRIRAGETVNDIAKPYKQAIADTLELNQADVSLDDKLLSKAMQGQPGADGKLQGMAVWQVQQAARQDDRWRNTNNARDAAGKLVTTIGQMMGKVAS